MKQDWLIQSPGNRNLILFMLGWGAPPNSVQQLPFPTLPITVHLLLVAAITAVLSLLFGLLARSMKWSRWLCG